MTRGLAAVLFLLAALPLACGGGQLSPDEAVAAAATKTPDAGSSRMSFEASMSGAGLPQAVQFTGEGEFDYEARMGRISYDLGGLLPGGDGTVEVILDGLVLYMQLPGDLGADLPAGAEWLKIDLNTLGEQVGIDLGALSQLNQGDPSQVLMYLRGATEGIEEIGEEEVRGVSTTHYRGDVDLRKAADVAAQDAPEETREAVREAIERTIELTGTSTIPVDVWIDDDGRARRFHLSFELQVPGESGKAAMDMRMDLYDFGVEVDVAPPAAEEVVDLGSLLEQEGA